MTRHETHTPPIATEEEAEFVRAHLVSTFGEENINVYQDEGDTVRAEVGNCPYTSSTSNLKRVACIVCGGIMLKDCESHPYLARRVHIGFDDCSVWSKSTPRNVTHITLISQAELSEGEA